MAAAHPEQTLGRLPVDNDIEVIVAAQIYLKVNAYKRELYLL